MALSIWETFLAIFDGGEETGEETNEEDDDRFVPSPLDLSVRIGHGGSDSEKARELYKTRKRAQELEEKQRDK